LSRGFSITENETGEILRNAKNVNADDKLKIRLANGKLEVRVLEVE
jgi:exonuclease VII large subunit